MNELPIGQRLRVLREAKGRSRASIAIKLHVTKTCVTQWELGYRLPNFHMLEAYLCEIGESIVIGVPR